MNDGLCIGQAMMTGMNVMRDEISSFNLVILAWTFEIKNSIGKLITYSPLDTINASCQIRTFTKKKVRFPSDSSKKNCA